jgi:hypothetical protein
MHSPPLLFFGFFALACMLMVMVRDKFSQRLMPAVSSALIDTATSHAASVFTTTTATVPTMIGLISNAVLVSCFKQIYFTSLIVSAMFPFPGPPAATSIPATTLMPQDRARECAACCGHADVGKKSRLAENGVVRQQRGARFLAIGPGSQFLCKYLFFIYFTRP